jgi:hypothetical protein
MSQNAQLGLTRRLIRFMRSAPLKTWMFVYASMKLALLKTWMFVCPSCAPKHDGALSVDVDLGPVLTQQQNRVEEHVALQGLRDLEDKGLEEALKAYQGLHEEEEDRKKCADTRLTAILGMSSIMIAIVFGFSKSMLEEGYVSKYGSWGYCIAGILACAVLQLVVAVRSAIHGLRGRRYVEIVGVLPNPGEARREWAIRMIGEYAHCVRNHRAQNASKQRELAVAHRALLNFLATVLLVLVVVGVMALGSAQNVGNERRAK